MKVAKGHSEGIKLMLTGWFNVIIMTLQWLTFISLPLRQSGTPRERCHHQHQRWADHLSQRCQQCYTRGRHPADSGEARQRGRDPEHCSWGDWTLMSHLTEQLTPQQSTNLELALSVFLPITDTLKPEQSIAKVRAWTCILELLVLHCYCHHILQKLDYKSSV